MPSRSCLGTAAPQVTCTLTHVEARGVLFQSEAGPRRRVTVEVPPWWGLCRMALCGMHAPFVPALPCLRAADAARRVETSQEGTLTIAACALECPGGCNTRGRSVGGVGAASRHTWVHAWPYSM